MTKLTFGPFVLDRAERLLSRDGRAVSIGNKELQLLLLFVEKPNHLFTKDELFDAVWPDEFPQEDALFKTISRLRKTLGGGLNAYVRHERRRGYRWVCPIEAARDLDENTLSVRECTKLERSLNIRPSLELMVQIYEFQAANLRALINLLDDPAGWFRAVEKLLNMLTIEQKAIFFYELALKADQAMTGAKQGTYFDALEAAGDNLRLALDFYNDQPNDRELEMAVALGHFWELRRKGGEGLPLLKRAVGRASAPSLLKAKGLTWMGEILSSQNDYPGAKNALLESVKISRAIEDQECLALGLQRLATAARAQRRYGEAKRYLNESLEVAERVKWDWLIGWCLNGLGSVTEAEGDHRTAGEYHERHLTLSRHIGDTRGMGAAYSHLGVIACEQGDLTEARAIQDKALALRGSLQHKWGVADCHLNLGLIESAGGRHREAANFCRQGLELYRDMNERQGTARALEGIGKATWAMGNEKNAARIFGAADAIRARIHSPLSQAEQKNYGQLATTVKQKYLAEWKDGNVRSADDVVC